MTTTNKATYTTQPMAEIFGWKGEHLARRGKQTTAAPPVAQPRSTFPSAEIANFEKGRREAFDATARTVLVAAGTYAAIRGLQRYGARKRQQRGGR